jgi:predicted metal-dependent HD superfamily phosphohydrolase
MKVAKESQNLQNRNIIGQTVQFVKQTLQGAESGHDWWHIQRVWNNAILISKTEQADTFIIELAALLHDIADSKFHDGDEEIGPQRAGEFLKSIGLEEKIIIHIQQIIRNMSFKASLGQINFHSKEMEVVQDADRLDAIGAIGIAYTLTSAFVLTMSTALPSSALPQSPLYCTAARVTNSSLITPIVKLRPLRSPTSATLSPTFKTLPCMSFNTLLILSPYHLLKNKMYA